MVPRVLRPISLTLLALAIAAQLFALTHTVRKGENLSEIAKTYGVSINALKAANDLANANKIRIGQKLTIPNPAHTVGTYTVRRGDSISSIAAQHGTSTKKLAAMNGITNANKIRVGQKLKVPLDPANDVGSLTSGDRRALSSIRVNSARWKHIILHHTATSSGTPEGFDKMHRRRGMENGLAYHFLIGNGKGMEDGELYICDRWKRQIQGGHVSSAKMNEIAIGVCLVGNFEQTRPTQKQMDKLEAVLTYLMDATNVSPRRITTHTIAHKNHTLCPGKYFPFEQLKRKFN